MARRNNHPCWGWKSSYSFHRTWIFIRPCHLKALWKTQPGSSANLIFLTLRQAARIARKPEDELLNLLRDLRDRGLLPRITRKHPRKGTPIEILATPVEAIYDHKAWIARLDEEFPAPQSPPLEGHIL